MPYISEKILLNKKFGLDNRVKITDGEKQEIQKLYKAKWAIRKIAREYPHISRRSIQFILYPERAEKVVERAIEVKRWEKYNKKEYHTPIMRKYRHHQQKLYLEGKLAS